MLQGVRYYRLCVGAQNLIEQRQVADATRKGPNAVELGRNGHYAGLRVAASAWSQTCNATQSRRNSDRPIVISPGRANEAGVVRVER